MNSKNTHNSISNNRSLTEVSRKDAVTTTESRPIPDDEPTATNSTYESFSWLFSYLKMYATRLARDLYTSLKIYWYPNREFLPSHIVNLMQVQKRLRAERESLTVTYSSCREQLEPRSPDFDMREFLNEFTSCVLSSEDDAGIQFAPNKDFDYSGSDREPMFVIIDSSCVSNPSSKELLIDNRVNTNNTILKKHFNKSTKYVDVPSTSRDLRSDLLNQQLKEADSTDELLMMDINLQSDNELSVGDSDGDSDSIVLSYLRNKDAFLEMEGTIMSTKKKSSLLESVPKMETIIESEQFSTFPLVSRSEYKSDEILNNGDTTN